MKKFIIATAAALTLFSISAYGAGNYSFENNFDGGDAITTVTSSLASGGTAVYTPGFKDTGLQLNGSYGLYLGDVGSSFSVSAMVKISSSGGTQTVFFKNMGSKSNEQWTGVVLANGVPKFWTSGWQWKDSTAENCLNKWIHLVYTEDNGTGRLYVDGSEVSNGSVSNDSGSLYLGATYWSADAPSGVVDELSVYDRALTQSEIEELSNNFSFKTYTFPYSTVISDIDLSSVPNNDEIVWTSSNESVISKTGEVTRQTEDCTVTLTGKWGDVEREFTFTVLGLPQKVNDSVILSYDISKAEGGILRDSSGNGNHGAVFGGMTGSYFDGVDDYVEMPQGILNGYDEFSIVLRLTPEIANSHQFTFCFGNSTTEYFFLNTSRPNTNTIRLAITNSGSGGEKDVRSIPGLRKGEYASVVITAKGSEYKMYVDGIPVAEGDMGMSVSELGDTTMNYIGKSPYSSDPYFKGNIEEFSIYPYVMDEEEISQLYYSEDEDEGYFKSVSMNDTLSAELNRDCMVAVSFYDENGALIYATTKKVSEDDLTVEFETNSAAYAEVSAFDAATGIVKEQKIVNAQSSIVAYKQSGGSVKIDNTSDKAEKVIVIDAQYNDKALSRITAVTVDVEANSFEVVPCSSEENHKLFVWTSYGKMIPLFQK